MTGKTLAAFAFAITAQLVGAQTIRGAVTDSLSGRQSVEHESL